MTETEVIGLQVDHVHVLSIVSESEQLRAEYIPFILPIRAAFCYFCRERVVFV